MSQSYTSVMSESGDDVLESVGVVSGVGKGTGLKGPVNVVIRVLLCGFQRLALLT